MLNRLWQWLKRLLQRLFGGQQIPASPPVQKPKIKEPPQLTDAEYESVFLQLLAGVNDEDWGRGRVTGFLDGKRIDEAALVLWLRGFGERLLGSATPNDELALRMVQLGELCVGELGDVAGDIGRGLQERRETNDSDVEESGEGETGEAETWFNQGNEQLIAGDFAGAIASYDNALQVKPDYHEAWYKRGNALDNLGQNEQAIASYDNALQVKPDDHQAWYNRGVVLANLGQYEQAIASYDNALQVKPDKHEAWCNRGLVLDNLGQNEQAIASFDNALQVKPDDHEAWCNRGVALANLGQYEQAIASYDKALKVKPDDHEAWYNRGVVLANLGQYEQAIASFDKALQVKPDDHEAWYNQGLALANLGQYEQAIASYDKALQVKPDYHQAWYNRGVKLADLGQYEQAIASYDKALQVKPDYHQAWYNRGNALFNLGQYEQAIASYDNALKVKPDKHQAWLSRGNAAGNSVSCDQLLAFSSPIARQNPHLNQRGYEGRLASYEEGLKYCHQETHPEGWGLLHREIGNAHYLQGRLDSRPRSYWHKAVTSYNEALKTLTAADFPELHLEVLQDLIRVQSDLGETAKAAELQRRGTDVLRRLLNEPNRPDQNKEKLALKFAWLQQLTVDLAVQSGELVQAVELAEQGKNACLSWLLDGWSDEIDSPSYSQMRQLLNPTTAIVYLHLSYYALHTFILKHDTPDPILLKESRFVEENGVIKPAQRLRDFEDWLKNWNEQYADYPKGKKREQAGTWRENLPEMLSKLAKILNINTIVEEIPNITQLILIPHRDLHRLPLHALFPPEFTISYLPSFKIGLISRTPQTNHQLLSIEHPESTGYPLLEFAQIESQAISRMFTNPTRIRSEEVTKAAVISALPQPYNIFHFTGHGEYNFHNPAVSFLALAGEDRLTLADIRHYDLTSYQLVSLAACETAITGNHTITTEYVGLVSGFMSCGVAHVVSTLWTVESEASALVMMQFYQLLQQGKSEAVALAEATQWLRQVTNTQLAEWYTTQINELPEAETLVRRFLSRHLDNLKNQQDTSKKPYNHPYFWAAFTITGISSSCYQSKPLN